MCSTSDSLNCGHVEDNLGEYSDDILIVILYLIDNLVVCIEMCFSKTIIFISITKEARQQQRIHIYIRFVVTILNDSIVRIRISVRLISG